MGGALIVISAGDHKATITVMNINKLYVAETVYRGEKYVLNQFLGP